jgi:hypothetical protein
MKRDRKTESDEMRPEYDFAAMKGGVRGKYAKAFREGTNLVLLDEDVAKAFPTASSVNETLRAILTVASRVRKPKRARSASSRPRAGGAAKQHARRNGGG